MRLRQRLRIAVVGVDVGPHEAQDDGQLAIELQLRRALFLVGRIRHARNRLCGRQPSPQCADAGDTESGQPEDESGGKDSLEGLSVGIELWALGPPEAECQNLQTHMRSPALPRVHS